MMAKYLIVQTVSGVVLGTYEGATREEALDALARDEGYDDYAHLQSVIGETPETDTLEITEQP